MHMENCEMEHLHAERMLFQKFGLSKFIIIKEVSYKAAYI